MSGVLTGASAKPLRPAIANDIVDLHFTGYTAGDGRFILSINAFLARLYQEGTLAHGSHFPAVDIARAFTEKKGDGENPSIRTARQHELLHAFLYILIAGERMVQEIRKPTEKRRVPLDAELWRNWADGFQKGNSQNP